MNLENYDCEGQMELEDYLKSLSKEKVKQKSGKKAIPEELPKVGQSLEELKSLYPIKSIEWIRADSWNYKILKNPLQDDVYYVIHLYKGTYIFTYMAYAKDKWWWWDSWKHIWTVKDDDEDILAWVSIPSEFMKKDRCLPELLGMNGIIEE